MILLRRKAHFSAAHRLHNPQKSDQWNQQMFGECGGEHWHGHNYKLEVAVAGKPDPETGYIIDLFELKAIIHEQIVEKCDHKNLNLDVSFLEGVIPSTENLAKVFYDELKQPVAEAGSSSAFLYAVTVEETKRNSAVYCPYLRK
jgi:6-pyruvoyltetrahydropterin/6-carboxytetrahydropterin synthase